LRTDDAAPARQSTPGTRTLAVDDDGSNLAAALKTIQADGDRDALARCLELALGVKLEIVEEPTTGRLQIQLSAEGNLFRPMRAAECPMASFASYSLQRHYSRYALQMSWFSMSPRPACTLTS
jgi:predicted ATPase